MSPIAVGRDIVRLAVPLLTGVSVPMPQALIGIMVLSELPLLYAKSVSLVVCVLRLTAWTVPLLPLATAMALLVTDADRPIELAIGPAGLLIRIELARMTIEWLISDDVRNVREESQPLVTDAIALPNVATFLRSSNRVNRVMNVSPLRGLSGPRPPSRAISSRRKVLPFSPRSLAVSPAVEVTLLFAESSDPIDEPVRTLPTSRLVAELAISTRAVFRHRLRASIPRTTAPVAPTTLVPARNEWSVETTLVTLLMMPMPGQQMQFPVLVVGRFGLQCVLSLVRLLIMFSIRMFRLVVLRPRNSELSLLVRLFRNTAVNIGRCV